MKNDLTNSAINNITILFKSLKILLLLFFISFILWIIFCFDFYSGEPGTCQNPMEAKELGVFVAEFKPSKDSILFAGNDYLTFGNIWIEKQWNTGNRCNRVKRIFHESRKLIIEVPQNKYYISDKYFGHHYPIELLIKNVEHIPGFRYLDGKRYISFLFEKEESSKLEYISVIKPSDTSENNYVPQNLTNPIVIDSFYLIKK